MKLYKRSTWQRTLAQAKLAAEVCFLPQVACIREHRHALVMTWKPGRTLTEILLSGETPGAPLKAAGERLAELHAHPTVNPVEIRSAHKMQGRLEAGFDTLSWLLPAFGPLARPLWDAVQSALTTLDAGSDLLHGDFYSNQVLVTDEGVALLDFDELHLGRGESDLGLFIAHLEYEVLRGRIEARAVPALTEALLAGYRKSGDYDEDMLRVYTVLGLLELAHRPFRDCLPDWPEATRRLLERSRWLLRSTLGRPAKAMARDAAMPCLDEALNSLRCEPALLAAMGAPADARLTSCRLLQHKPGRRAVIEYRIEDTQGERRIIGKCRAKGLDTRTWKLMEHLSAAPVAVPRPLGTVPSLGMWLQEKVSGKTAWEVLSDPRGIEAARRIAESLFSLHRAGPEPERSHRIDNELAILAERLKEASKVKPDWESRIRNIAEACNNLRGKLAGRPKTGIHRDFYPDQVLCDGASVWLLDFDLYCLGDPALDVGNFVAHLQEHSLRNLGHPNGFVAVQQAFIERYREVSADPGLPEAADLYRRLTLARHIAIALQLPERRPFAERVLDFCEAELGTHHDLVVS